MYRYLCALICAFLVISQLDPTLARKSYGRGGSHSYPHSGGGLSGGGSHSYPKSGGLSGHGGGSSHGYPSSGGLSGSGSRGYPSSGSNSGYPSGGLSGGTPSRSGYPTNTQTHHSGSHGYPSSTGLSGNANAGKPATVVHHHYHYSPPKQISYAPSHGGPPMNYPVYRGQPPNYVYQYKDSGSKYGTLLAGLALLNLGTLGASAYAVSQAHHSGSGSSPAYRAQSGEVCKFGLRKENGDYEETRIDCQLISSFIFQDEEAKRSGGGTNTTTITTSVTNITTLSNGEPVSAPVVPVTDLSNTTLTNNTMAMVNTTAANGTALNATDHSDATAAPAATGPVTSSVTVTTTNTTTVTNAVDVKGPPVAVTSGMKCYVIRTSPVSNMKKTVPCGLLQTYAEKSLKKNSATQSTPAVFTLLAISIVMFALH